jgi:asparagine synthase (glutamine-hydrolysing)
VTGVEPYRLRDLELAAGQALAPPTFPDLPQVPAGWTPRDALTAALVRALEHTPCVVSFSGGRDSSAVLALAAAVARAEGLPLPVPVTKRYPGIPESDESEWQETVIRHLRLDEWIKLDLDPADYHVLGPVSARLLRQHGLLWPSHIHLQLPTFEAARGGTVVTGVGGDEILGGARFARAAAVLARDTRPVPRDVLRVGYALAPPTLRQPVLRRRFRGFGSWLRPPARRRAIAALAAQSAAEPLGHAERLSWWLGLPYIEVARRNIAFLAAQQGITVVHPLLDAGFISAFASLPRDRRPSSRSDAMRLLFGDLLPDAVLTRRSKASFDHVDAPAPRFELLARWNGEGVDPLLVDPEALRAEWARPLTDPSTTPLLQSAWLALDVAEGADSAGEPEQLVGNAG